MNNLSINGRTSFNFSYDGVTNKDTGQNGANYAAPALDSIAEVRVQASNFQAEYRRSWGATITVVTRSGASTSAARGLLQRDDNWTATSTSTGPCAIRDRPRSARRPCIPSTTPRGRSAGQCWSHDQLRRAPDEAVFFFFLAGHPRAHRCGHPEPAAHADRARTAVGRRRVRGRPHQHGGAAGSPFATGLVRCRR